MPLNAVLDGPYVVEPMTALRRAWATLGLRPGASLEAAHSAYRGLAKRWHPDRFVDDPAGQAQAAIQMRVINGAYRTLLESAVWKAPAGGDTPTTSTPGRRLSKEEIDRIVSSIGSDSAVEAFLDSLPSSQKLEALRFFTSFDPAEEQWALTPMAVFLGVLCAGLLALGAFEWSGNPLSRTAGRVGALLVVGGALLASIVAEARRGW